ncbi:type IV toxin-antitoxin system AbiEi family antitoxin [Kineosporia corallincola]|nr:type IV toxin-antitoxin system AbiEi family antitoxin [Kineosporia corallincola]
MDDAGGLFLTVGPRERAALLAEGLAREVVSGLLVLPGVPVTTSVRALALRARLGPHQTDPARGRCFGFATAAWVHGGFPGLPAPAPLDLVIGRNRRSPRLGGVRVRQVDIPPEQVQLVEGVPVTAPLRTATDVARDLPRDRALPVLRLLQELHDVHPPQVLRLLTRMPYARGVAVARDVVRAWAEMA